MVSRQPLTLAVTVALGCSQPSPGPAANPAVPDPATPASTAPPPTAATPTPTPTSATTIPVSTQTDGWALEPVSGGTVRVRHRFSDVIGMRYLFFGPKWQWSPVRSTDGDRDENGYPFLLSVPRLEMAVSGRLRPKGANAITIELDVRAHQPLRDISGVGIEFRVRPSAPVWGETAAIPKLAANHAGFTIPGPNGSPAVDVRVEGKRARVFFERGNTARVRVFVLEGDVEPGQFSSKVTITLPPQATILPSIEERYGSANMSTWAPTLTWNDWPVDVSFLNDGDRPAGKHGAVEVRDDQLVFADGTLARFWGTNISAHTLFQGDREAIRRQARRIAALGYNLVRLHHHDSKWVRPNIFANRSGNSQTLDDRRLETLDWWVKCLQDEGVYVWVDLHVGRRFLPGDAIAGYTELQASQDGEGKGFNYVNPRIERLMQRFVEQYINRRNRYTGRNWATDPGIVAFLVTNENDLGDHFGLGMLPNKGNPHHRQLFDALALPFAKSAGLNIRQARRLWEPGPAKVVLAELQHRFDARAIKHLRSLGVTAPIVTTSYWGNNKLYTLPPLTAGDLIDVHAYGEAEALGKNPRFEANFVNFIAGAQVVGKPLTVTEWNVPPPRTDRFTAPMYVSATASLQGWDAMLLYAYNQGPNRRPRRAGEWTSWTDPGLTALTPAAAVMFRRGDVSPAQQTYVVEPGRRGVYESRHNANDSATIRTLTERSRVLIALPDIKQLKWDKTAPIPPDAVRVSELDRDFIPAQQSWVESDTGELRRDWGRGIHTVDTARSVSVSGWMGGRKIELRDTFVEVTNPKATIALTSLDGQPLTRSVSILLTVVARSTPGRDGAYRSEPVTGQVGIASDQRLGLVPLSGRTRATSAGLSGRVAKSGRRQGRYQVFTLDGTVATHWFLLQPQP